MNIVYKKLQDLTPYHNNPRNNENAIEKVASSIHEFGFKVPIVIDEHNIIVAGHTRYLACEKLGITDVPCIVANDLSPQQIKAFRLADNKVSEYSNWNTDLLKVEFEELMELEFDLDLTGFTDVEIMLFTEDVEPEVYDTSEYEEYDDYSEENNLKAVNIVISCMDQDEIDYMLELFKEPKDNKRLFKAEDIIARYEEQ